MNKSNNIDESKTIHLEIECCLSADISPFTTKGQQVYETKIRECIENEAIKTLMSEVEKHIVKIQDVDPHTQEVRERFMIDLRQIVFNYSNCDSSN